MDTGCAVTSLTTRATARLGIAREQFTGRRLVFTAAGAATNGAGGLRGRIARATFLGDSREYLVDLDAGGTLRAATPPAERHAPGEAVLVKLDPARCRLLAR